MEVTVVWTGTDRGDGRSDMAFSAVTETGHTVHMDGAASAGDAWGGRNEAPRPMELVLAGTGGCTAYDVVLILRRGRQRITGCRVELKAERAVSDPKIFTKIDFHFIVTGYALDRGAVERAVKLSHEKYCSASVMLEHSALLSYSIDVVEAGID